MYKLPNRLVRWLETALANEPHKAAALAIAELAARVYASPKHLGKPIYLSRPEIMEILSLKDWETRQGTNALVRIGFLDRQPGSLGAARRVQKGIRRPATVYRWGSWLLAYFKRLLFKRKVTPAVRSSAPVSKPMVKKPSLVEILTGGSQPKKLVSEPFGPLEAALARLGEAFFNDQRVKE